MIEKLYFARFVLGGANYASLDCGPGREGNARNTDNGMKKEQNF